MGSLLNSDLTFDGGVSTADQQSGTFSTFGVNDRVAFMFDVDLTQGPLAVTLQINGDPTGNLLFGWQDYATTDERVLDLLTSDFLDQTEVTIEGGEIRAGVIKGGSNLSYYLLEFSPLPASYRLNFQITSATQATINNILTIP